MSRAYELKRRAERQDETRRRIVEATIELHQTIGPAATTVTEIAERAGVGRVTVYRHFPDEPTLSRACSGLYFQRNPLPDPERWRAIADAQERFTAGLLEVYAWYAANHAMIGNALADAREHPVMVPYHAHWELAASILDEAWAAPAGGRQVLHAAIATALSFDTWRTLVQEQGLADAQAAALLLRLTRDGA
jgi:AcrR family transcriptional regulator